MDLQRAALRPPIWEARRMAQDVTPGDLTQTLVFADVVIPRQILIEGLVQVEFARVDELQNGVGEDRLAQTGGFKDRGVGDRLIRLCIFHAEAVMPHQFAVTQQCDRKTGRVAFLHQLRDALFNLRNDLLFVLFRPQWDEGLFRRRLFLSEGAAVRDRQYRRTDGNNSRKKQFHGESHCRLQCSKRFIRCEERPSGLLSPRAAPGRSWPIAPPPPVITTRILRSRDLWARRRKVMWTSIGSARPTRPVLRPLRSKSAASHPPPPF